MTDQDVNDLIPAEYRKLPIWVSRVPPKVKRRKRSWLDRLFGWLGMSHNGQYVEKFYVFGKFLVITNGFP